MKWKDYGPYSEGTLSSCLPTLFMIDIQIGLPIVLL